MNLRRNSNESLPDLIVLTGPTAVGKTSLSIELARRINGEIISADSIQIYKYMDIGSAKVTPEEMDGVKHYLIDMLDPSEAFNVAEFQRYAKEAMKEIYAKGKIPIIAGGTGFYIQALLYDINFNSEADNSETRKRFEKLYEEIGAEKLHEKLREVDPESADAIHYNNVKRVIRALEYFYDTGEKISAHNETEREKESPYNFLYYVLNTDRDVLYERIDRRVDLMIEQGLVDEVKKLLEMGYDKSLVSMQGLGYKEIVAYLEGETDLDEAVRIIKRDTRHFAKRQLTWFRREREVRWLNLPDFNNSKEAILDHILADMSEKDML